MNTSFNNFLMSRFSQISINRALFATVDTRISAGIDQDFHEGEKQTDLILNMALKTVKTIKKVRSSVQELRTLSRSTCSHDRMNAVFGVFFRSFSDPCSDGVIICDILHHADRIRNFSFSVFVNIIVLNRQRNRKIGHPFIYDNNIAVGSSPGTVSFTTAGVLI